MALPILDGNQTATTLSTVLTSGEHIPAHTVVSLGSTAISNIASAVSGSVVSVSNFPSTQTIAGTVTANSTAQKYFSISAVTANRSIIGYSSSGGNQFTEWDGSLDAEIVINGSSWSNANPAPVSVANSVTIGSLPAISGTVTANVLGYDPYNGVYPQIPVHPAVEGFSSSDKAIPVIIGTDLGNIDSISNPLPISGTVTANGYDGANDTYAPIPLNDGASAVMVRIDETNGNLPIFGTVTANNPNGALTTRFGSVATANLAFITSAVTNTSRKYLLAQNISAGTVTIGIGFSPTTTQGIQLTAGGGLTFDAFCPTGAVYWLGAVTGANYCLIEG